MTDEARRARNQLSRLVHLPCTSTTSIRPITADAIRTEIIIANSVVGSRRCTAPKWVADGCCVSPPISTQDQIRQPHHQQTQKDSCYYDIDPFSTRVREPPKHCVDHGWPLKIGDGLLGGAPTLTQHRRHSCELVTGSTQIRHFVMAITGGAAACYAFGQQRNSAGAERRCSNERCASGQKWANRWPASLMPTVLLLKWSGNWRADSSYRPQDH
jgi:hypothetical protein